MIDIALRKRYCEIAALHAEAASRYRIATTNYERGVWFVECLELFAEIEDIAAKMRAEESRPFA